MLFRSRRVIQRQTLLHAQFARFLAVHNVNVPSMGDSISEGTLVEILKGKGEYVQEDQVVAVLETDKVCHLFRSVIDRKVMSRSPIAECGCEESSCRNDCHLPREFGRQRWSRKAASEC